jgi:Alpha/beta hydrolase family
MRVLLVHGLWRTPLSFLLLVRRLQAWGYGTDHFGYMAIAQRYEAIVTRLVDKLEVLARGGAYAVIGHSLGGILLRSALSNLSARAPEHLVMLGTPNRPSRLASLLRENWGYRKLTGECGSRLASPEFYATLPVPRVPYTIVAGTAGSRGRWSPFGLEPNDGLVAVSETKIKDDDPVVLLPAKHTFMMNNIGVQRAIRRALTLA